MDALCYFLRRTHAATTTLVLWPTPEVYTEKLRKCRTHNRSRNGNSSSDDRRYHRGGGEDCGHHGGVSGRKKRGGSGHSDGGSFNGRREGPTHRGKVGRNGRYSGAPSDASEREDIGVPFSDVKAVLSFQRQVPSLVNVS